MEIYKYYDNFMQGNCGSSGDNTKRFQTCFLSLRCLETHENVEYTQTHTQIKMEVILWIYFVMKLRYRRDTSEMEKLMV